MDGRENQQVMMMAVMNMMITCDLHVTLWIAVVIRAAHCLVRTILNAL